MCILSARRYIIDSTLMTPQRCIYPNFQNKSNQTKHSWGKLQKVLPDGEHRTRGQVVAQDIRRVSCQSADKSANTRTSWLKHDPRCDKSRLRLHQQRWDVQCYRKSITNGCCCFVSNEKIINLYIPVFNEIINKADDGFIITKCMKIPLFS